MQDQQETEGQIFITTTPTPSAEFDQKVRSAIQRQAEFIDDIMVIEEYITSGDESAERRRRADLVLGIVENEIGGKHASALADMLLGNILAHTDNDSVAALGFQRIPTRKERAWDIAWHATWGFVVGVSVLRLTAYLLG